MCDYKYMEEQIGIDRIVSLLETLAIPSDSTNSIIKIITNMSYTKVKVKGLAKFENPIDQLAYNIVREADLLTAYDFDRSVIYAMLNKNMSWIESIKETKRYFKTRVLLQILDGLFVTKYGLSKANELHDQAINKIFYSFNLD